MDRCPITGRCHLFFHEENVLCNLIAFKRLKEEGLSPRWAFPSDTGGHEGLQGRIQLPAVENQKSIITLGRRSPLMCSSLHLLQGWSGRRNRDGAGTWQAGPQTSHSDGNCPKTERSHRCLATASVGLRHSITVCSSAASLWGAQKIPITVIPMEIHGRGQK